MSKKLPEIGDCVCDRCGEDCDGKTYIENVKCNFKEDKNFRMKDLCTL